ncbi:MAG: class I SAM-dependent methyltransferase [Candidatus Aminicenantaceae bacterium]
MKNKKSRIKNLFTTIYEEFLNTLKKPRRILDILNKDSIHKYFYNLKSKLKFGDPWIYCSPNKTFRKRVYSTPEDYIKHQKSKQGRIDLSDYDLRYREVLRKRLENLDLLKQGMNALCLGARIGTEVKSFLDLGCFAIGIDLSPGENNRYVVYGDFHETQFSSNSIDIVFTNSLDHVLDIKNLINEIKRLLKPNGLLIIEAVIGSDEGRFPSFYESFWWSRVDDLVSLFENSQFILIKRSSFDYPWDGEQLCFKKS